MSRYSSLLFILVVLLSPACLSQQSFLFLKKGAKKKRTWVEGDVIRLQLRNGDLVESRILLLRNDSIYFRELACRTSDVARVILKKKTRKPFPVNGEQAAYIAGGVVLSTIGIRAAGWEDNTGKALLYSSVIGFGPIILTAAVQQINLRRKEYRIRKKFRLQVLDFYVPRHPSMRPF